VGLVTIDGFWLWLWLVFPLELLSCGTFPSVMELGDLKWNCETLWEWASHGDVDWF